MKNFDKKSNKYRFVKVNGLEDVRDFKITDIKSPVFFDKETVDKFIHIKDNLYEFKGDYYVPQNYGFFYRFLQVLT